MNTIKVGDIIYHGIQKEPYKVLSIDDGKIVVEKQCDPRYITINNVKTA